MAKIDYISGTEEAYVMDGRVALELVWDTSYPKSYLVKFKCDPERELVVPKSLCELQVIPDGTGYHKRMLIVQKWFLDKNNVKYK
ncbi:hypothetical protein [Flavobacterium sp.]|uniref:hypothetical protein n=1 Tax=Flavobacterium sp. TaxID=239 RepID=UPI003D6A99F7